MNNKNYVYNITTNQHHLFIFIVKQVLNKGKLYPYVVIY